MDPSCKPGTVLNDKYRIDEPVSKGRYDVSYRALDLVSGAQVSVKEMMEVIQDPAQQRKAIQQLTDQYRTLSRLSHPGLPRAFEMFEQGGHYYLVTEYVEAQSVETVISQADELPSEAHAMHWLNQLLDILEYLHGQAPPVIYRDLRPATIMVTPLGQIKLLDFGIAKMVDPNRPGRTLFRAVGSPEYAPPESFGMSRSDARTDIYALGACLYFALTGTAPPQAADRIIRNAQLRDIREINPSVSERVQAVIRQMMSVRPVERPESIAAVRAALSGATPLPAVAPPPIPKASPQPVLPPAPPPPTPVPVPAPATTVRIEVSAPQRQQPNVEVPRPAPVSTFTLVLWSVLVLTLGLAVGVYLSVPR